MAIRLESTLGARCLDPFCARERHRDMRVTKPERISDFSLALLDLFFKILKRKPCNVKFLTACVDEKAEKYDHVGALDSRLQIFTKPREDDTTTSGNKSRFLSSGLHPFV